MTPAANELAIINVKCQNQCAHFVSETAFGFGSLSGAQRHEVSQRARKVLREQGRLEGPTMMLNAVIGAVREAEGNRQSASSPTNKSTMQKIAASAKSIAPDKELRTSLTLVQEGCPDYLRRVATDLSADTEKQDEPALYLYSDKDIELMRLALRTQRNMGSSATELYIDSRGQVATQVKLRDGKPVAKVFLTSVQLPSPSVENKSPFPMRVLTLLSTSSTVSDIAGWLEHFLKKERDFFRVT